jgi:hypothetical protein
MPEFVEAVSLMALMGAVRRWSEDGTRFRAG